MTPRDRVDHAVDRMEHAVELMADKMAEVKPRLRGWLHAGTAPLALAAGIVLVALSPTASTRVGSACRYPLCAGKAARVPRKNSGRLPACT